MFMQRFTGTRVRTVIAQDGTVYRIDPPTKEDRFWTVRWSDLKFKKEERRTFEHRFDEAGNDLGRKEAQDFLQERR